MNQYRTIRSSIGAKELGRRFRELRESTDLSPQARGRVDKILKDIQTFEEFQPVSPSTTKTPSSAKTKQPKITRNTKHVALKPGDLSNLVSTLTARADLPATNRLDFVTTQMMQTLRKRMPRTLSLQPVPTGSKGGDLPLTSSALTRLLQLAAVARSDEQGSVIWDDGINQLIVYASRIKAVVTHGLVRIDIPVVADQLKAIMQVPFAVGSKERPAGLVAATAARPSGNAVVAQVWGDALIALAYGALMDTAESLAGATGRDVKNDRLVPRALVARQGQLTIESQASHFKRQTP